MSPPALAFDPSHTPITTKSKTTTKPYPTLVNEKTAAKILSVSPSLLQNWRYRKLGPAFILFEYGKCNRIAYDVIDLQAFIDARRQITQRMPQSHKKYRTD